MSGPIKAHKLDGIDLDGVQTGVSSHKKAVVPQKYLRSFWDGWNTERHGEALQAINMQQLDADRRLVQKLNKCASEDGRGLFLWVDKQKWVRKMQHGRGAAFDRQTLWNLTPSIVYQPHDWSEAEKEYYRSLSLFHEFLFSAFALDPEHHERRLYPIETGVTSVEVLEDGMKIIDPMSGGDNDCIQVLLLHDASKASETTVLLGLKEDIAGALNTKRLNNTAPAHDVFGSPGPRTAFTDAAALVAFTSHTVPEVYERIVDLCEYSMRAHDYDMKELIERSLKTYAEKFSSNQTNPPNPMTTPARKPGYASSQPVVQNGPLPTPAGATPMMWQLPGSQDFPPARQSNVAHIPPTQQRYTQTTAQITQTMYRTNNQAAGHMALPLQQSTANAYRNSSMSSQLANDVMNSVERLAQAGGSGDLQNCQPPTSVQGDPSSLVHSAAAGTARHPQNFFPKSQAQNSTDFSAYGAYADEFAGLQDYFSPNQAQNPDPTDQAQDHYPTTQAPNYHWSNQAQDRYLATQTQHYGENAVPWQPHVQQYEQPESFYNMTGQQQQQISAGTWQNLQDRRPYQNRVPSSQALDNFIQNPPQVHAHHPPRFAQNQQVPVAQGYNTQMHGQQGQGVVQQQHFPMSQGFSQQQQYPSGHEVFHRPQFPTGQGYTTHTHGYPSHLLSQYQQVPGMQDYTTNVQAHRPQGFPQNQQASTVWSNTTKPQENNTQGLSKHSQVPAAKVPSASNHITEDHGQQQRSLPPMQLFSTVQTPRGRSRAKKPTGHLPRGSPSQLDVPPAHVSVAQGLNTEVQRHQPKSVVPKKAAEVPEKRVTRSALKRQANDMSK